MGGIDFEKRQFDHVSQARRQPQALFQPWIAALGIDRLHLSPVSILDSSRWDEPLPFQGAAAPLEVKSKVDRNSIFLHDALVFGNQFSILRVANGLGSPVITQFLGKAGFSLPERKEENNTFHRPLMTLMEATSLYGALAGSGQVIQPRLVQRIEKLDGELLYQAEAKPSSPLVSPEALAEVRQALVEKAEEGSGRLAKENSSLKIPRALYHTVSEGFLDSSCVGVTPRVAVGVWWGAIENKPLFGSRKEGEEAALPLWTQIVDAAALSIGKEGEFVRPAQMTEVELDRTQGRVRGFPVMGKSTGNALVLLSSQQLSQLEPFAENAPTTPGSNTPVYSWSQWFSPILAEDEKPKATSPTSLHDSEIIPEKLELIIPGVRGNILTKDGQVLATVSKEQSLVCTWPSPEEAMGDENLLAAVHTKMKLAERELGTPLAIPDHEILERYHYRRFQPLELVSRLTPDQIQKFQKTNLERYGLTLQGYPLRSYPQGHMFSHALGYLRKVQSANGGHYQANEVVYDDYSGSSGLEAVLDEDLRGEKGVMKIETREDGFLKHVQVPQPSKVGNTVRLTIDSRWQKAVEAAIHSNLPTAGVVMDVKNGDILAMASNPDYDPNDFIPRMSPEVWKALSENEAKPLLNRVYRQQQPPGSTFKIVTTLSAMQAGTFDAHREVNCVGTYKVGNVVYKVPREVGVVDFRKGMALSFNSYFFDMALRMPKETLVKMGQEMGLGQKTGFILPYEVEGSMPTPESIRQLHNRLMGPGDVTNMAIGQGDVLATPLQMVRLIAGVANRGTFFTPRLVARIENAQGQSVKEMTPETPHHLSVMEKDWNILHESLRAVVTEGTAQNLEIPHLTVAAKTGTAQAGNKKDRQVAWVIGFAPYENPQIAFAFMMEGDAGGNISGGHQAGPMALQALQAAMLPPSPATKVTEIKAK